MRLSNYRSHTRTNFLLSTKREREKDRKKIHYSYRSTLNWEINQIEVDLLTQEISSCFSLLDIRKRKTYCCWWWNRIEFRKRRKHGQSIWDQNEFEVCWSLIEDHTQHYFIKKRSDVLKGFFSAAKYSLCIEFNTRSIRGNAIDTLCEKFHNASHSFSFFFLFFSNYHPSTTNALLHLIFFHTWIFLFELVNDVRVRTREKSNFIDFFSFLFKKISNFN